MWLSDDTDLHLVKNIAIKIVNLVDNEILFMALVLLLVEEGL